MSEQYRQFPEFYVTAPQACPYLEGQFERKLFTHLTPEKPDTLIDGLLRSGFRRSQNIAYMPYCDGCNACVSVRLIVGEFEPTASMKRVLTRNSDIVAERVNPRATGEQYQLFKRYVSARHGDGGMADMSALDYAAMVEDSVINTTLTEYRLRPASAAPDQRRAPRGERWPLIGVALVDRLSDGVSMAYSFFDPDMADRSLGTLMILEQADFVHAEGLQYLYLGYQISGSRKMAYKARFLPQERLSSTGWLRQQTDLKVAQGTVPPSTLPRSVK
jgi:leucyl-tRNA---protein transferase